MAGVRITRRPNEHDLHRSSHDEGRTERKRTARPPHLFSLSLSIRRRPYGVTLIAVDENESGYISSENSPRFGSSSHVHSVLYAQ